MKNDDRHRAVETLAEMLDGIPVGMLTTCLTDGSLRSRPMINVNHRFEGDLWFFTHRDDPKAEEITQNPHVNVSFASPDDGRYVSITGAAALVQDAKRVELLWSDTCEKWFPQGTADPKLALLRVDVQQAEYWDEHLRGMVALGGLVQRALTGNRSARVEHEKIQWGQDAAQS